MDEKIKASMDEACIAGAIIGLRKVAVPEMTLKEFVSILCCPARLRKILGNITIGDVFGAIESETKQDAIVPQHKPTVPECTKVVQIGLVKEVEAGKVRHSGSPGATRDEILAMLSKQPMSQSEVVDELMQREFYSNRNSANASVRKCHFRKLCNQGLIMPLSDDTDGKWRTV